MRLPSPRFLVGLVLVLVACVAVAILVTRGGDQATAPAATITCVGGSEKSELMADPEVKQILADRYGLTVEFTSQGSYDQVQRTTDDLVAKSVECLWPSSASAQEVFEAQHKGAFVDYTAATVLQSPEVIYAGPQGTDALVKAGIVQQRDGKYFLINLKSLLVDYVLKKRTWESLNAGDLRGPIAIASTDAAKSNSGFTMAQLQLNIISTNDVFSAPSVEQAKAALPTMRAIYDAQGLQARSSDQGFKEWLLQGGEFHAPLYAGYENQIVQQVLASGANGANLLKEVRILYPDPTVYSDHPILALTPDARRLIEAMKDKDIQKLAWERYGFRSGTEVGANDVAFFKDIPLAQQFRTTRPPSADVTLLLLGCVKDASACT